jgi:hypothetical protein
MDEAPITLKIANISVPVPMHQDRETTEEIAGYVTDIFKDCEKQSKRIDTPVTALQAAYIIATQLYDLEQESAEQDDQVADTLGRLADRLNAMVLQHASSIPEKK